MTNKELVQLFNSKKLLISLYHHPSPISPSEPHIHYIELNKFRQKIEEEKAGPHHQPYRAGRKKALFYQSIFFTLGFLFLFLCLFMYTQSMNWSGSLFFVNYTATKITLCSFTLVLAFTAFVLGYSIKTEKEAANQIIHRAQNKLIRIFAYKRAEFGMNRFFSFAHHFKKHLVAKQAFHDSWEKIRESKKVTYALLEQISRTKGLDSTMMETLFNEAILELNDKLHIVIQEFKKTLSDVLEI